MNKPLHQFFTEDHHRLESLLNKAMGATGRNSDGILPSIPVRIIAAY
jgi:hypothetical protein